MPWWTVVLAFFVGFYGGMMVMSWFMRRVEDD